MMKASFMEKLLDGVNYERKILGEISSISIGEFVHKNNQNPLGKYPVYNGGKEPTGYYDKYNNSGDRIIVSARGANAGFVNKISTPYWAGNSCYSIDIQETAHYHWEFIFYYLKNHENKMIGDQQKGSIPSVSKKQMEAITIPIPCPENPEKSLEIQAEIVRILNTFTKLTAELIAELIAEHTARKKQYIYYRDQLLTFKEGEVEWKALGDIGEFMRGNGLQKKDLVESGVGCIHYGQIYTYYGNFAYQTKSFVSQALATKLRKAQKGDLIIATTSENIEDVCKPLVWLGEDEVCVSGETYVLKHNQNPKYLAYYLQTPMFFDYKKKNRTGTKVIRVHGDKLAKFEVPLPSLYEQERIVSILDKFDALTSSITEGLPHEIELHQKQYEYYRNMLLSFPKEEVEE